MDAYRAMSLFQPSNLALAIEKTQDPSASAPKHLFGCIMAFPHTMVARSVAVLGFDFVMIDALHTAIDTENLVRLIHMINLGSEGKTCAVVRVPSTHSDLITHALDAGAAGIIFPHIDTPEDAAIAVSATDMAPPGKSHLHMADRNIAVIVQIESKLALKNLESIAATPGLNALMLGPGDLRVSLGLPSKKVGEYDDPRFLDAVDDLVTVSKKHRKPLMTVAFKVASQSDMWIKDFAMLLTSADIITMTNGFRADLRKMEDLLKKEEVEAGTGDGGIQGQATVNGNGPGTQREDDYRVTNGNGGYSTNGNREQFGKQESIEYTNGNGKAHMNGGQTNGHCHVAVGSS